MPLNEGENKWKKYIETIHHSDDANCTNTNTNEKKQLARYFMLEFVQEEDDRQFFEDAKTLTRLLG